jgi:phage minor structural protein
LLRVFAHDETNFNNNGLCVLNTAKNVKVNREINGEYRLTFSLPVDDEKWKYIKSMNKVVCEGQQFRIYRKSRLKSGTVNREIDCLHVISDAGPENEFISTFNDQIGKTPRQIFTAAFAGTQFYIMTDAEVAALGMEWVTTLTDVFKQSKVAPLDIVKQVIAQIGEGELYIDNYNIALVKRIGRETGHELSTNFNLKSIEDVEDGSKLVTRLYAFGKDDMTIGAIPYIDSPNIALYGIRKGFKDYDHVTNKTELLRLAQWEFDSNNINRIDVPDLSYSVSFIELYKIWGSKFKINLGDTVKLKDSTLEIATLQRIIKYEYYPYSPQQSAITLGRPPITYNKLFSAVKSTGDNYNKSVNASNQTKSDYIEDEAITEEKIRASAVTTEKLETNAVTTEKLEAGAVTAEKCYIDELSAITANLGVVTAGIIRGVEIYGTEYFGWNGNGSFYVDDTSSSYVDFEFRRNGMTIFEIYDEITATSLKYQGESKIFLDTGTCVLENAYWKYDDSDGNRDEIATRKWVLDNFTPIV